MNSSSGRLRCVLPWLAAVLVTPAALADASHCAATAASGKAAPAAGADTVITGAKFVAATAMPVAPAYCELTAVITPVPGSRITAVYRLPDHWNGRMLGLGV